MSYKNVCNICGATSPEFIGPKEETNDNLLD